MFRSIFIVLSALAAARCARILAVYSTPSVSHQVFFRPITEELLKRGHEVVVITTDPAYPKGQTPKNLTEIDVHDISYGLWNGAFHSTATGKKNELVSQVSVAVSLMLDITMEQLKVPEVADIVNHKNGTFDLIFIESWVRPSLLFSHFFKNVPVISISSFGGHFGNYETIGTPIHPILYPMIIRQRIHDLSAWDKIKELHFFITTQWLHDNLELRENEALRKHFGHDFPTLSELKNNVAMMFFNLYPIWDTNRPVPPSVVYIGGVYRTQQKKLPEELESYLNSSKNGVVYVSFGTNCDTRLLDPEKIQAMVKAFSQLPYDILWKWNTDVLPGKTDNIRISKWLPQPDLLKHPKIKVFITQAGLQSTDEAIQAGVPLIGIPMLADQWYHAEKYVHFKMGMKLDMETLTTAELKEAVENVVNNRSYRDNVVKFREMMNDVPMKPMDRVIWWTEHLIRHGGGAHLRAPAANMSWWEFLEMDLVLLVLGFVTTGLSAVGVLLYYVIKHAPFLKSSKVKQS